MRTGWGGPRPGAGRTPASKNPPIHHVRRPRVPRHCPSHVTLRVQRSVSSLRSRSFLKEFRRSLREACERGDFRVVHYSVQRNHVHLLVESAGKKALGNGMKAVASRLAHVANRVFGHSGAVLYGRYHLRVLRTPREVRNALAYVLLNARNALAYVPLNDRKRERHRATAPVRLDEASSARWFDGWKYRLRAPRVREPPEVAGAHTWLLTWGWRRHGRIDPAEVPGR